MSCVCGEPEPHEPPVTGCLWAIYPQYPYEIPRWIRRAERLVQVLADGDPRNRLRDPQEARRNLAHHVTHMLDLLEMACGGRS